jgi:cytoskeletal protein CcmA (bactofilin family)
MYGATVRATLSIADMTCAMAAMPMMRDDPFEVATKNGPEGFARAMARRGWHLGRRGRVHGAIPIEFGRDEFPEKIECTLYDAKARRGPTAFALSYSAALSSGWPSVVSRAMIVGGGLTTYTLRISMFQRSSSAGPPSLGPRTTTPTGTNSVINSPSSGEKSVIGNDLKIIGQGLKIISRGVLQVDGEIEGDVMAVEVVVGEKGKVSGMVAGQQVVVRGTVSGVVRGKTVALQASSQVEGDIHHMSFAIEQGAHFEGRSRRARGEADLLAVAEGRGTAQATEV